VKTIIGLLLVTAGATYLLLPPSAVVVAPGDGTPPVRGVLHVHTSRSDGTGTADAVAAAAARAGLSFVVFTDHGDASEEPTPPIYRHGVLCIDAVEISTDQGHVLALGLPKVPFQIGGLGVDVLEDIARFGGMSILAHPTSARLSLRWTGGDAGFDGVEWLNGDSEWRDEPALALARAAWTYWFRPAETLASLLDRPVEALALWDRVAGRRAVVGVAAADAHARVGLRTVGEPYDGQAIARVPGYESSFRTFSIVLPGLRLTGMASADAAAALAEIRSGRVVSVLDGLAGPAWLEFSASNAAGQVEQGAVLAGTEPLTLRARAPNVAGARLRLLRDGREIDTADTTGTLILEQPGEPATFRVEVSLPSAPGQPPIPWLVSNPIYVGRQAAVPWSEPVPPEWPARRAPLYTDGPVEGWTIEHSVRADGRVSMVKAITGTQLNMRFALGGSRADSPFVALTHPFELPPMADSLLFEGRASRAMRISAQLRSRENGGGRRWTRSVFLDETMRRVAVPFRDFLPAGHDTALALDAIGSLLFVIDGMNTALGQSGQVWLDNVALGGATSPQVRTDSRR
jgi:hypothetical protein